MRVLLVSEWFVKYTAGLARGLSDAGCQVVLMTRDHDLEFGGEAGAMREFVRSTVGGDVTHLELGGRVRDPRRLMDVARLRRWCRDWKPDVVHVQDSLPHDVRLGVAAGFPQRKYALTVHDPAPHPGDSQPSARIRFLRRALRNRADLLFVHSESMAAELRASHRLRGAVVAVPHGFREGASVPLPENPSLLFFGRISHYKGLDTLLDAMPLVWEREPGVTLVIAGEGEVPRSEILADPRVSLRAEHVPEGDVPTLFEAATCVVLPYRQASQSGVGAEARRFGRAIVAAAVGGLSEMVDSSFGRLVPPEDPAALATALVEVVSMPGLAATMGRRAAESGSEASWDRVADMTLDAYRRELL